jgi:hypothetical protein
MAPSAKLTQNSSDSFYIVLSYLPSYLGIRFLMHLIMTNVLLANFFVDAYNCMDTSFLMLLL